MHSGTAPQVLRKARERILEADAARTFGAWLRSPAYREAQARAALMGDRAVLEALAARLGCAESA